MRIRIPAFVFAAAAVSFIACQDRQSPTAPSDGQSPESPTFGAGATAIRLQSVTVSPAADTIGVGETVQLTATANPPTAVTFVWKSKNTGIATVDQNGLVTGVKIGKVTIEAKAGGRTGRSIIWVVAAPPPPPPRHRRHRLRVASVMVGAGDVASCSSLGDEATANLLDAHRQAPCSRLATWPTTMGRGRVTRTATTRPGDAIRHAPSQRRGITSTRPPELQATTDTLARVPATPTKGYYSYDVGDWHVVVLNSNIARTAGSAQEQWLRLDLAASTKTCTLAYWHHPRFSSSSVHGNDATVQPFWQALYDLNADVVLVGHDHSYERFAPQTPTGVADATRGIRQFVVGTGGRSHYALGTVQPNSQVYNGDTWRCAQADSRTDELFLGVRAGCGRIVYRLGHRRLPLIGVNEWERYHNR